MVEAWKQELRSWAQQVAEEFRARAGVLGVAIGGSLARGQEWRHSDLELGVLVAERDQTLPYFNIRQGRGVEGIQLVSPKLSEQVSQVEQGDLAPLVTWPIQLWKCRITHDPTGLLARFKQQFDTHLLTSPVMAMKLNVLRQNIDQRLGIARETLAAGKPAAALAHVRWATNDAIQAAYWAHGELPRSQNRTDSRLHALCRRHAILPFYALYRELYGLDGMTKAIKTAWPKARDEALEITRLWGGDSARDFFIQAVDADFTWRQNAGILTVYRLYIPHLGGKEQGIIDKLDDPTWTAAHQDLLRFLGLADADPNTVATLIDRLVDGYKYFSV